MKQISKVSLVAIVGLAGTLGGCNLPGKSSSNDSSAGVSAGASGGTSSTPSTPPAPTYGMNCTSSIGSNYSSPGTGNQTYQNIYYINANSMLGSSVNSVTLNLSLPSSVANSNIAGSLTLTAYTCGSSSSPGSNVASVSLNTSLNGYAAPKVFDFSGSPIAIPTNCSAGQAPLVFKLTTTTSNFAGYPVMTQVGYPNSSCMLRESSSLTGLTSDFFIAVGSISANP